MDSKCPIIENVDDNSNQEEVNDTTLSSQELQEQENNSNEVSSTSVNDNESAAQTENSDEQEQTRNLVNKSLQGDSVESSDSTASMMEEANINIKTDQSESESVNNQQVRWNLILQGRLLLIVVIDLVLILKVSCLLFVCQNCDPADSADSADSAQVDKNIYRVKWIR